MYKIYKILLYNIGQGQWVSLVRLWGGGGTLTALTFLDHYLGLPALPSLAALCVGLVDAHLLYRKGI